METFISGIYDTITLSGASLVSHLISFTFMTSGMIIDIYRVQKAKKAL